VVAKFTAENKRVCSKFELGCCFDDAASKRSGSIKLRGRATGLMRVACVSV
jgi:hypothetical protein